MIEKKIEEYSYKAGFLVVLTAPSGAGKTTIRNGILKKNPQLLYSISCTTRPKRENEVEGKDYFFVSISTFKKMIKEDQFLEWAKVHKHYYGTPKGYIKKNIANGKIIIMDIDVQGGINIKKRFPDAVFIFILPPSFKDLEKRLRERGTENEATIKMRVENAKREIALIYNYNYLIINDEIEHAIDDVQAIIEAEKLKISRNVDFYKNYLK